ncbi:MAG: DUF3313 family protein [Bdellovibrionota bacterium]|jgi:hypothetical protein
MRTPFPYFVYFLISFALCGCSAKEDLPPSFLANMDDFKKHDIVPDFYLLKTPQTPTTKYHSVIIETPLLSLNREQRYYYADPSFLKFVTDLLREQVALSVGNDFKITESPSPKTFRLRLAITNVTLPDHKTLLTARHGGLVPISLDDTILEAYFEDSLSGDLLGGVRDLRIGKVRNPKLIQGFSSPLYLKSTFAAWSGELRAILYEICVPPTHKKDKVHSNKKRELKEGERKFTSSTTGDIKDGEEKFNSNTTEELKEGERKFTSSTTEDLKDGEERSYSNAKGKLKDRERKFTSSTTEDLKDREEKTSSNVTGGLREESNKIMPSLPIFIDNELFIDNERRGFNSGSAFKPQSKEAPLFNGVEKNEDKAIKKVL